MNRHRNIYILLHGQTALKALDTFPNRFEINQGLFALFLLILAIVTELIWTRGGGQEGKAMN
jgi:hypothetical protein